MADSTYSVVERYMLGWGLVQLCKNKKIIIFALKNILGNLEVSNFQTQYYAIVVNLCIMHYIDIGIQFLFIIVLYTTQVFWWLW